MVLFLAMITALALLIAEVIVPKAAEILGIQSLMRKMPKNSRVGTAVHRFQRAFVRGADLMVRDIGIS